MLHLFFGPIVGCLAEIGIIVEHAAQIPGVVAPITLDHRRGFHQRHERGVHGRGIERVPGNIFDPPMFHLGVTLVGSNRGGASAPRSTIYAYRTWRETCVTLTLGRLCYSATLAFDPQGGLQRQVPGSSPYAEERTVESSGVRCTTADRCGTTRWRRSAGIAFPAAQMAHARLKCSEVSGGADQIAAPDFGFSCASTARDWQFRLQAVAGSPNVSMTARLTTTGARRKQQGTRVPLARSTHLPGRLPFHHRVPG